NILNCRNIENIKYNKNGTISSKLVVKLYIDDLNSFSNKLKSSLKTLNYASELIGLYAFYLKMSKTFFVILNEYYLPQEDRDLIINKLHLVNDQLIEIKDYGETEKDWKGLGNIFTWTEMLKRFIPDKQLDVCIRGSYVSILYIPDSICRNNHCMIKRSILIAFTQIGCFSWYIVPPSYIIKFNKFRAYGLRKNYGILITTNYSHTRTFFALKSITSINDIQYLNNCHKSLKHPIAGPLLIQHFKLIKNEKSKPMISRTLTNNNNILTFIEKYQPGLIGHNLKRIFIKYNINLKNLSLKNYEQIILKFHWQSDLNKIYNNKHCLINWLFDLNEYNTSIPYDSSMLKNYELIIKLLKIKWTDSIQILRIILGNYKNKHSEEKTIKQFNILNCKFCGKNIKNSSLVLHILSNKCIINIPNNLNTLSNYDELKSNVYLLNVANRITII
ncbi:MAG: hypothetical protein GY755_24150, partial [Chloroflexi bacterium]|nr:hypothetical protein [Chloroflexota bacterium]